MKHISFRGEIIINDERVFHRRVLIEKSNRILVKVFEDHVGLNKVFYKNKEVIVEDSPLYVCRGLYMVIHKDWIDKDPERLNHVGDTIHKLHCTILKKHV